MLVSVLTLALAPAANAERGIEGFYNFPILEGEPGVGLSSPKDIAVNGDGSGGADPGDFYVADGSGFGGTGPPQNIKQYSAGGELVRLWGGNVVASGSGQADETQAVTIFATSGSFKLGFGGETTTPMAFNASATEVETALNALASIGGVGAAVTVSGGPGDASGSSPYLVTFGGVQADNAQPLLTVDNSGLTSPGATSFVASTNKGGSGREVCEPSNGDKCQGGNISYAGVAIDPANGKVFAPSESQVDIFSAKGEYQRSFGYDVVLTGPHDSTVNEVDKVVVKATGGTFSLSTYFEGYVETEQIKFDATPAEVEAALNAMPRLGTAGGGAFKVSGGPGDGSGSNPYLVTFGGVFAGDNVYQFEGSATNLTGPGKELSVETTTQGGGPEICTPSDVCQRSFNSFGQEGGGVFYAYRSGITVAPSGTPNAGNVLLAEGNSRVQEFDSEGNFIRLFGWDVDATNPSTGFEICTQASGDKCKYGSEGNGLGQFSSGRLTSIAEDSTGAIYVLESRSSSRNSRIQKFTQSGSELTPSVFGKNEVQKVTVKATGGAFRLRVMHPEGAFGHGTLNTPKIENISVERGIFKVGQPIGVSSTKAGTRITSIDGTTIRVDNRIGTYCGFCAFSAPELVSTGDLPAGASAAEVQAALNGLAPISQDGGSVTVTGGPGDAGGTTPYAISFDGGTLGDTDQPQIVAEAGSTPLSGGTGEGANTASAAVTTEGGPGGRPSPEFSEGNGGGEAVLDIGIGPGNHLFVTKEFRSGWGTCESGLLAPAEVRLLEYDSEGNRVDTSRPCTLLEKGQFEQVFQQVSVNQSTGTPYVLSQDNTYVTPDEKCCIGGPKVYLFGPAGTKPDLVVNPPSNLSPTGVTISGTIDPNGPENTVASSPASTQYRIEYKKPSQANWEIYAPDVSIGIGSDPIPFSVGISGLTPKAPYEARVVVTKPFGFEQVIGATPQFTTLAAPPLINAVSADHVTASSVDLHAVINALGSDTTYHFEYGPTPGYGSSTPEAPVGEGIDPKEVNQHVEGLEPIVYHFRVVATNALGTTMSTDQSFNFYPEPCPNSTVRQQTGSSGLPDCRAYELVSPENSGSSSLLPGGPNHGEATSPSRFPFIGGLGSIPGPWNPPNTLEDMYVATRTDIGWKTHYVGIPGDVAGGTTGPPNGEGDPIGGEGSIPQRGEIVASPSMDKFLGWNPGQQGFICCGLGGSMAPFVFSGEGDQLGRWPTNVTQIQGGLKDIACWTNAPLPLCGPEGGFIGDEKVAPGFGHYFFSSGNVAFAPGGLTSGMGSAYDNDVVNDTVTIVSKLQTGGDIPKEPGALSDDYLAMPGASRDGSNVLMAASGTGICGKGKCSPMPTPCGISNGGFEHNFGMENCPPLPPSHLYMRVDNAITYDVSDGNLVEFKGMSDDGSKVYFTSIKHLTTDDTDSSMDLFQWSEGTDEITKVSRGEGSVGDTDACNSSWVAKCGIKMASPEVGFFEYQRYDKAVAQGGDVYFYSPEQLAGSSGIPGRRNLYAFHNGNVQYVATLEPKEAASRLQISPDGEWAAFVTPTKLTAYDNQGFDEMYRYNAVTEELRCVSCLPTGNPPMSDVEGSQNGLYLTNDGRTFFATEDAVVPQDTDGIVDIYEYVLGSPELISTGIGQNGEARFGGAGLVGVTRNGLDVYFSTFETLVPSDRNGGFIKFYDARTNGGFVTSTVAAPCAAADECHGPGNAAVTTPKIGSTAPLGNGRGNQTPAKAKKHKKKHKKKKHQKQAKKKAKRHSGKGNG